MGVFLGKCQITILHFPIPDKRINKSTHKRSTYFRHEHSVVPGLVFAVAFLGETLSLKVLLGAALIIAGTLVLVN